MLPRMAPNCHAPGEMPPKAAATTRSGAGNARGCTLAYKMIAERENEKYSFARESRLLIVAKAKVWASEGWRVVITDQDGKAYAPPEFDRLLAA
ncbi:hypothetical protein [Bradyrhizobium sp. BR 10261]|uniref:hypothetical protein n=1 Tax=Bradyrhizobium sp. BR 10261 TaxID=2749992 RepID=UPI001E3589C5|nr:hypothetical protein [Bradyrhizobium sp. BR 10261]